MLWSFSIHVKIVINIIQIQILQFAFFLKATILLLHTSTTLSIFIFPRKRRRKFLYLRFFNILNLKIIFFINNNIITLYKCTATGLCTGFHHMIIVQLSVDQLASSYVYQLPQKRTRAINTSYDAITLRIRYLSSSYILIKPCAACKQIIKEVFFF